ncbi:uncharacterized protein At3g27210-like [Chenopodium quinoa]|uniref:Uncharacterized protein n=1 Tax=Chenopodium quinoa TaxID=63459 RepID=A0A803L159_CHEQI|nr:uncharacterized protein At3g27210-like [Chenopodium quinoa]
MKNMKRVFLYLGMSSCVSTKTTESPSNFTLEKALNSVQSPVWEPAGSKEETFYDSKPWLDSDDEQDFFSINSDTPPYKLTNKNEDQHQGRRLSELFKDSSFSRDSLTSAKAQAASEEGKETPTTSSKSTPNNKMEKDKKSGGKSVKHCLPSLVRSLSCGDRKKRPNPAHIAVAG